MFKVGDNVWYAKMESIEKSVRCPECFGLKYLTIIFGDQSEATIDCAGCQSGYEPPKGFITYHAWEPRAWRVTISGMDIRNDKITYWFTEGYGSSIENVLFQNQEAAEIRALELAEEHNQKEIKKINKKDKDHRNWSWHAHYHRARIREAEKALVYHTAKLNVAKTKSKEEKKEIGS